MVGGRISDLKMMMTRPLMGRRRRLLTTAITANPT
jgi:hypothetical protein